MNNAKKKNPGKAVNIMYTQQIKHLPFGSFERTMEVIASLGAETYGGIIHDKDPGKEPHIHVFMHFKAERHVTAIAKKLRDKPQYIEIFGTDNADKHRRNQENGYAYLIHMTAGSRHKHPYDAASVVANFDYPAYMERVLSKDYSSTKTGRDMGVIDDVCDLLGAGLITLQEAEDRLTGSQYGKGKTRLKNAYEKHQRCVAREWQKERTEKGITTQVIWLYGRTWTGKSNAAKNLAERTGKSVFTTGSGNDPFQEYENQRIVIVDEFRPGVIAYRDLLRLCDPYAARNGVLLAPARYVDKALTVDVLFITTPYSPYQYYLKSVSKERLDPEIDLFDQLERRLPQVFYMTQESISRATFDERLSEYTSIPFEGFHNPFSQEATERGEDIDCSKVCSQLGLTIY